MDYVKKKFTNRRKYDKFDNTDVQQNKKGFIAGLSEASRASISQVIEQQIFDVSSIKVIQDLDENNNQSHFQHSSRSEDRKRKIANENGNIVSKEKTKVTKIAKPSEKIENFDANKSKLIVVIGEGSSTAKNLKRKSSEPIEMNYAEEIKRKLSEFITKIPNYTEFVDENGTIAKTSTKKFAERKNSDVIFDENKENLIENVETIREVKENAPKNNITNNQKITKDPKSLQSPKNPKISKSSKTKTISQKLPIETFSGHQNYENKISEKFENIKVLGDPKSSLVTNQTSTNQVANAKPSKSSKLKKSSISPYKSIQSKFKYIKNIIKTLKPPTTYNVQQGQIESTSIMRSRKLSDMPKYRKIRSQSVDGRIEEEVSADLREALQGSPLRFTKSENNFDSINGYEMDENEQRLNDGRLENIGDEEDSCCNQDDCDNLKSHDYSENATDHQEQEAQVKIFPRRSVRCENDLESPKNQEISLDNFQTSPYISKFARSIDNFNRNRSQFVNIDTKYHNNQILRTLDEDLKILEEYQLEQNVEVIEQFNDKGLSTYGQKPSKSAEKCSKIYEGRANFIQDSSKVEKSNKISNFDRMSSNFETNYQNFIQSCPQVEDDLHYSSENYQEFAVKSPNLNQRISNFSDIAINPENSPKIHPETQNNPESQIISELKAEIENLKLQNYLKDIKIEQLEKCEKLKDKQIEKISKIADKKFTEVSKRENLLKIVKIQAEISNKVAQIKTESKMKSKEIEKFKEVLTERGEKIKKLEKILNTKNSEIENQQKKIAELEATAKFRANELAVMAKCWEESHEFACKLYEAKRNEWKQKLLDLKKVINNLELKVDEEEIKENLVIISGNKTTRKRTISSPKKSKVPQNVNEVTKKFIRNNFDEKVVPRLTKCLEKIEVAQNEDGIEVKRSKLSTGFGNVSV